MNIFVAAGGIGFAVMAAIIVAGIVLTRKRRSGGATISASRPAEAAPPALDPFIQGSATEKRQTPRRGKNPVRILVTDAARKGKPREGWVMDRSHGGLRLRLPPGKKIREGTILRVCALESSPLAWVEVLATYCVDENSGRTVGCQFVSEPPSEVLWTFG
jgi:hypothetical protein